MSEQNTLRIASYNILAGGENRLDFISNVIKEINPDICGILEAVGWQDKKEYFTKYANDLGYDLFEIAIANSKYNIAIFSKIPLEIKTIKQGFRHVVLEAKVKSGPYEGLSIFFVHLSPKLEDDRLLELEELFKNISQSEEVIIIGDFNSLSPHDSYDKDKLLEIFNAKNITKYGTDVLRFNVIEKVESFGFIDAANYLKYPFTASTPTPSNQDINHAANIRIDYAFLSKEILECLNKIEIVKNSVADQASDHYPLVINLIK